MSIKQLKDFMEVRRELTLSQEKVAFFAKKIIIVADITVTKLDLVMKEAKKTIYYTLQK